MNVQATELRFGSFKTFSNIVFNCRGLTELITVIKMSCSHHFRVDSTLQKENTTVKSFVMIFKISHFFYSLFSYVSNEMGKNEGLLIAVAGYESTVTGNKFATYFSHFSGSRSVQN